MEIVDLTAAAERAVEQAARLLHRGFRGRSEDWQDLDGARAEVRESLVPGRASRVAVDAAGEVIGWIGGIPCYGRVRGLHPLVVGLLPDANGPGKPDILLTKRLAGTSPP